MKVKEHDMLTPNHRGSKDMRSCHTDSHMMWWRWFCIQYIYMHFCEIQWSKTGWLGFHFWILPIHHAWGIYTPAKQKTFALSALPSLLIVIIFKHPGTLVSAPPFLLYLTFNDSVNTFHLKGSVLNALKQHCWSYTVQVTARKRNKGFSKCRNVVSKT